MPLVHPRGDPASRIWFIFDHPYPSDVPRGYMLSGGLGFAYEKMLSEAGLNINDCYIVVRRPDTEQPFSFTTIENSLSHYQPPFVFAVNEVGAFLLDELKPVRGEKDYRVQLNKYVGSLLQSKLLQYPHYVMPVYGPDICMRDWTERNVSTYIDFQKMRDEFLYWKVQGSIQSLRTRKLKYGNMDTDEVLSLLDSFRTASYISTDIETVYPKAKSAYIPHPGYPVTIGLAPSSEEGMSFNLFRNTPAESRAVWRKLDELLYGIPIIGQNFFNFDSYFLEALGFRINLARVHDTLIRHHILWPELPHKLQFLTRQYTREPYYKDEGKHWSMKNMTQLRRYNCFDVCVTYEVFEAQEEEFKQRPHLKEAV